MLTGFFYLVFLESRIEIPSNMQSMKRHPSNNFYRRTFSANFIKAVFRTSRFCLKVTATEISSNLKKSFVNMLLNSHFTKSTEGEIWSEIHHIKYSDTNTKELLFPAK